MRRAALDVPSHAQVTVTSRMLSVASRDARERLVREKTGAHARRSSCGHAEGETPCPPTTLPVRARSSVDRAADF